LSYEGFAMDGEVEDYAVTIIPSVDLAVRLFDPLDSVPVASETNLTLIITNRGPSVATGVVLAASLPTSFTVLSVTNSQGSCANVGGTNICSVGSLGVGASATVQFAVRTETAGTFLSQLALSSAESEAYPPDNVILHEMAVIVPAQNFTNSSPIVIADGTASGPGLGDPYPSTLLVSGLTGTVYKVAATLYNVNHSFAGDLDVLLVGPGGESVLMMSDAAGAFVLSGVSMTFDDDAGISLPVGGVISSTRYRPTNYDEGSDEFPPPAPPAPFGGTMSVFRGTDPNGVWSLYVIDDDVNDTGSVGLGWRLDISTLDPIADIAVSVADSVDPVAVGSNLVYTITVTNRGPAVATDVFVTNQIPEGVSFIGAVASQGTCTSLGGVVTCQLGNLAPSANAFVAVTVVPLTLGSYTNTARASAAQVDFMQSNNVASAETAARLPVDVTVAQRASTNLLVLGQQLTYTLDVTNRGPNTATNVRLVDPLPANVSFVSASSPQAACTNDLGTIRCHAGSLAPGARAQVTVVVQPGMIGTITNVGFVTSDEAEIFPADNISTVTTVVNVVADAGVAMSHSQDPVAISNQLTYLILVTNRGPSSANAVRLESPLPPGLAFVSVLAVQGNCTNDNGTIRCDLGTLTVGQTNAVSLVARPTELGRLTNVVSLTTSSIDLVASNNLVTNIVTAELPPFIIASPGSRVVTNGADVSLSVDAGGSNPLTYQWQIDATNIAGANGSSLMLTNVGYAARGTYRVLVSNNVGSALSTGAVLTVLVPPSVSDLADQVIEEDAATLVLPFTVGDVDADASVLVLVATSSNSSLVPTDQIAFGGAGTDRTLEIKTLTNAFGSAMVTIEVRDEDGLSAIDSFVLTVNPVNDPPTIAAITSQATLEDTSLQLSVMVNDVDSVLAELSLSAMSSSPGLIDETNMVFSGTGGNRLLTMQPGTNQNGSATITVTVTDTNGATAFTEFVLTVDPVNDPPTIAAITNQATLEDTSLPVSVVISDVDSALAELKLSAVSSNPGLIDGTNTVFSGTDGNRLLTLQPATNRNGSATITVTVSDTNGATMFTEFVLTVDAVNDPPTLLAIPDQTTPEDVVKEVNVTVDDVDTALSDLRFEVSSSNPVLIAATNVVISGSGSARIMRLSPATNESGSATITVSVLDTNDAIASVEFTLTVLAENDAPTLAPIGDLILNQGAGQQTVQLTNVTSGASNELQSLGVTAVSSDPSIIANPGVAYSSPDPVGLLTFTPLLNTNATVTITVTVDDGGETNRTVEQAFTVTLRVLALPVITGIQWVDGVSHVTFNTETGVNCALEWKDTITAPGWTALPGIISTGTVMTVTDPAGVVPSRVYRVRIQ
jgi:uncharacterized repeat protein (TIGR01451 family)